MPKFFAKYWIHAAIWGAMIIYLVAAPSVHAHFLPSDGKPAPFTASLPATTKQVSKAVEHLDRVATSDQSLYSLSGWTFLRNDKVQSAYDVYVVLRSDRHTYFFLSTPFRRPGLNKNFPNVKFSLVNSGFRTNIARDALPAGSYTIGILFRHKSTGAMYLAWSTKSVVRTPNSLQLAAH